ncbi:hypothetical protein BEST7613_4621 [Synechocystis sp. PCC 6803]|nr:hypothetical protein BEST7613_4621 [Synechocystis sp. PCC 6803] [Bacillus subtilis BEST7613]
MGNHRKIKGLLGGRGAVTAPGPPTLTTFTLVKFLPFAPSIIPQHWRSPIDPSPEGLTGASLALGTTKTPGMNSILNPRGRSGVKDFHGVLAWVRDGKIRLAMAIAVVYQWGEWGR